MSRGGVLDPNIAFETLSISFLFLYRHMTRPGRCSPGSSSLGKKMKSTSTIRRARTSGLQDTPQQPCRPCSGRMGTAACLPPPSMKSSQTWSTAARHNLCSRAFTVSSQSQSCSILFATLLASRAEPDDERLGQVQREHSYGLAVP